MALTPYHFRPYESGKGFTLIELLVVTGIIVVISSLVLANTNSFGGKVQLENLAYDIALTVRQAQVYGISVQRFGSNATFAPAYGVHFVRNVNTNVQDAFVLFADINDSRLYDDCNDPATCELVTAELVFAGYHVTDLCTTTGSEVCGHASLDITFHRPNPDASIRADGQDTVYESARIIVTSPHGDSQSITVDQNGQIAVR